MLVILKERTKIPTSKVILLNHFNIENCLSGMFHSIAWRVPDINENQELLNIHTSITDFVLQDLSYL